MIKVRMYENREMFSSLQAYLLSCCQRYADRKYCMYEKDGKVSFRTYGELLTALRSAGTFLSGQNLLHRHVALLGGTSFEWIAAYLGCLVYGVVVVPLDKNLSKEAVLNQFQFADGDALVYDPKYADVATYVSENTGDVHCYCLKSGESIQDRNMLPLSLRATDDPVLLEEKELAEIVFTSGTTGRPKAVMLSCENLLYTVMFCVRVIDPPQNGTLFSILPNHHTFELAINILTPIYFGVSIGINDSPVYFKKNLRLFHPTHILVVPAVLIAIRKEADAKIQDAEKKSKLHFQPGLLNKKLMAAGVLPALGGRLTTIICGGAHLPVDVVDFFEQLGIQILQGYGTTECSPLISCNSQMDTWKLGRVSPYCEVAIQEGEICVRGKNVMLGYYKDPELTDRVLTDGWFHTGDAGELDEFNCLSLSGRMDRMLVLSNGENIHPEQVEETLKTRGEIEECIVSAGEGFLTAEIFPGDSLRLMKDPETVHVMLSQVIREVNRGLPVFARIERFSIRETPFPKTSTQKIIQENRKQEKNV